MVMKNISHLDYLQSRIPRATDLMLIQKSVKNWYEIGFLKLGLKKEAIIVLRSGKKVHIRNKKDYYNFINGRMDWVFELVGKPNYPIKIAAGRIRFSFLSRQIAMYYDSRKTLATSILLSIKQFFEAEYRWLMPEGKVVVDIGASVGDTAIYFCLRGARHVYSFEPFPHSYEISKKNVELNGLSSMVTLVNKAVSGVGGIVCMKTDMEVSRDSILSEGVSKTGRNVKSITLDQIASKYNLTSSHE